MNITIAALAYEMGFRMLASRFEEYCLDAKSLWQRGNLKEAWEKLKDPLPLHPWVFGLAGQMDGFERMEKSLATNAHLGPRKREDALFELAALAFATNRKEDAEWYAGEAIEVRKSKRAVQARSGWDLGLGYRELAEKLRHQINLPPLPEDEAAALRMMAGELERGGPPAVARMLAEQAFQKALQAGNGEDARKDARLLARLDARADNYKSAANWMLAVARKTNAPEDWKTVARLALRAQACEVAKQAAENAGWIKGQLRAAVQANAFEEAAILSCNKLEKAELLAMHSPEEAWELLKDADHSREKGLAALVAYLKGDEKTTLSLLRALGKDALAEQLAQQRRDKVASLSVLEQLEQAVQELVQHPVTVDNRPSQYIEGVPGGGKSTALGNLSQQDVTRGVYPDRILAITLTRNGAKVFTQRAGADVIGRTNHGAMNHLETVAARIDGRSKMRIATPDKALSLMERALVELRKRGSAYRVLDAGEVLEAFNLAREKLEPMRNLRPAYIAACLRYMQILHEERMMDFPGLMTNAAYLLETNEGLREYVAELRPVVDEYQDYNPLDVKVLSLLLSISKAGADIAASPSQSIYGFRGADFQKAAGVIPVDAQRQQLLESKRCSSRIVQAALPLAGADCKGMFTRREEGKKVKAVRTATTPLQADFVGKQVAAWIKEGRRTTEIAVLARTHQQLFPIADALRMREIPVVLDGENRNLFGGELMRAWAGYLRLALHPASTESLEIIANVPRAGFGNHTLYLLRENRTLSWEDLEKNRNEPNPRLHDEARKRIHELLRLREDLPALVAEKALSVIQKVQTILDWTGLPDWLSGEGDWRSLQFLQHVAGNAEECGSMEAYLDYLERENNRTHEEDGVTLATIHGAKGEEYPAVIVIDAVEGRLPLEGQDKEEEKRLAFVGFTRGEDELVVTSPGEGRPSPFWMSIPDPACERISYP